MRVIFILVVRRNEMKSVDVNVIEGTQRWTEQLKACGQSIIDNAEKLADISKFQT